MGVEGIYASGRGNLKQFLSLKYDDDGIDRWHRAYTCVLFILFAMTLSTSSYVGRPMICWQQPYDGVRQDYVDTLCWIKNTYFLPLRQHIPHNIPHREERELNYYQWVPLILLCQALMFYVPCAIWRSLSKESGINITSVVSAVVDKSNIDPEKRDSTIVFLSKHLDRCLEFQREYRDGMFVTLKRKLRKTGLLVGKRYGNFLYVTYMFMKILYIINVYLQLFILNWFLGTEYYIYGIDLMVDITAGRNWKDTGRFPRVTMCDFQLRVLGNLHRHTCQCVLPINLFNEKVYIFIWFWLFILAIITSINFIVWIRRMAVPLSRKAYIKKYLQILSAKKEGDKPKYMTKEAIHKFVYHYLRVDGVFVIRLVSLNTSDLMASELLHGLWGKFIESKEYLQMTPDETNDQYSERPLTEMDTIPLKDRDRTIPDDSKGDFV